jgi:hypothetical protein
MDLWQIRYTSIITGERQTYMDVGYESPELAKAEIKRLMRDAAKYKKTLSHLSVNEMYAAGVHVPSALIGKYWRVKKVKCKPI